MAYRIFLIFFIIILWIPIAGAIFRVDAKYGDVSEKRKLADFPDFAHEEIPHWPQNFEEYFDDNFGFRNQFVTANSTLRHKIFQLSNERVSFGKDDWMFLVSGRSGSALDQYRGIEKFSPPNLDQFIEVVKSRSEWFDRQGVKFLFVTVPSKSTIYPEFLPEWIHRIGPSHLDQIKKYIDENGEPFPYIDLREYLMSAKGRGPLYGKTGVHWNYLGSYIAYREILDRLRTWFPELRPMTEEDFELVPAVVRGRDLAQLLGIPDMFIEPHFLRLKLKRKSRVVDMKSWANGREREISSPGLAATARFETLVTSDVGEMPKVLFIRDSFTVSLFPFMNETFSQSHYVSDKALLFDNQVFRRMKPDVVVVIWTERAFIPIGKSEINFLDSRFVGFPLE